jgi:hypothetical protein
MDDLIAFLNARLGEDEAAANEIHRPRICGSVDRDGEFDPDPIWCSCPYPARVLREVEAVRRIIGEFAYWEDKLSTDPEYPALADRYETAAAMIRPLAAIWSDHPDYRDERKP